MADNFFVCYHTTTRDRVESILRTGLQPNSPPTWFKSPTPYVMLSDRPWPDLNAEDSVVLEVSDPRIKPEYFDDPEGLRWPYPIEPKYIRVMDRLEANAIKRAMEAEARVNKLEHEVKRLRKKEGWRWSDSGCPGSPLA